MGFQFLYADAGAQEGSQVAEPVGHIGAGMRCRQKYDELGLFGDPLPIFVAEFFGESEYLFDQKAAQAMTDKADGR